MKQDVQTEKKHADKMLKKKEKELNTLQRRFERLERQHSLLQSQNSTREGQPRSTSSTGEACDPEEIRSALEHNLIINLDFTPWAEIVGNDKIKQHLKLRSCCGRDNVINAYDKKGQQARGILLYGPPGTVSGII